MHPYAVKPVIRRLVGAEIVYGLSGSAQTRVLRVPENAAKLLVVKEQGYGCTDGITVYNWQTSVQSRVSISDAKGVDG
tara:strand:- start:28 stop:261 length:234 start_codon:yes stop_codon:yes gene_type:complete